MGVEDEVGRHAMEVADKSRNEGIEMVPTVLSKTNTKCWYYGKKGHRERVLEEVCRFG